MAIDPFRWWRWPDGLAWRWALRVSRRARRERFAAFWRTARPGPGESVLDVGVSGRAAGTANLFERLYPWPGRLTACGLDEPPEICRRRGIRFVRADGRRLPFADGGFDVAHCNAVLEHLAGRGDQRRMVAELLRVARRVWLATPDRDCPLELHTLVPLAHWLPGRLRNGIYRAAGRGFYAREGNLNLLSAGELRRVFPPRLRPEVILRKQYVAALPVILTAYCDARPQAERASASAGRLP